SAAEAGRLVHGAQVRAVAVRAPVLVEEPAQPQRGVAPLEGGLVLRHRVSSPQAAPSMIDWNPDGACGPITSCSSTPMPSRAPMRARQTCSTCRWLGARDR